MEKDLHRDISGQELSVLLHDSGLPKSYPTLTPAKRKLARMKSLTSWYDPKLPHILCTDVDKFVKAFFLWCHFYIKPAKMNQGTYYFADPLNKWDMARMVMEPPLEPAEPAKTVVTATRRAGKTQTIIIEMIPMMTIVRPYTLCLISQFNDKRSTEELNKIKDQVEGNERIALDFNARGNLYPAAGNPGGPWSSHHLQFTHLPGCAILAHSLKSAQRGRGPIFGVIDDPEDESNTFDRSWRQWFFSRLFSVYIPMFNFGGKLCWIGTPIHGGSCLSLAMKGKSEQESKMEKDGVIVDQRFRDFRRGNFSIIERLPKGGFRSLQPDRLTVKAFERKLAIDPISALKEILCEPVTPGTRAFSFSETRHGYMHCKDSKGEYFQDFHTGERKPWKEFLEGLRVFGAGDLADGQSADADPGALVYIGVDSEGIVYVLDAYLRRCFAEHLVEMAYLFAERWQCEVLGWERAGLLCIINRLTEQYVNKLRSEGKAPPVFREIDNAKKNKVQRILTLIPTFGRSRIRFLQFDSIKDPDGVVHTAIPFEHEGNYRELVAQITGFTDEGLSGHDDAIDALEMAIRLAAGVRGPLLESDPTPQTDVMVEKWREIGLPIHACQIAQEHRTEKLEQEMIAESMCEPQVDMLIPYV